MKAKYASAIREGLATARLTDYGTEGDRYYSLRSQLIWNEAFPSDSHTCRNLALEAFKRETKKIMAKRIEQMTPAQRRGAAAAFDRAYTLHTESRSEREMRLLREEVAGMRAELSVIRQSEGKA